MTGISPKTGLVEMVELDGHPWFLGCQSHPEFKSRPMFPHPLFVHFIDAAVAQAKRRQWEQQKTQLAGSATHPESQESTPEDKLEKSSVR